MLLAEALALFRRLGVDVKTMNSSDFLLAYFTLAKRYHPDRNPDGAELMASINAARATIVNSHSDQTA
jgi:curved DNA-binding protein CbpA